MNKILIGVIAVSIIAVLGVAAVSAYGFGFGLFDDPEAMKEQRQAERNAIEKNDYASWEALMQERIAAMENQITEENFQQIRERHSERAEIHTLVKEAIESGEIEKDPEAIKAYLEENGYELPEKGFLGKGSGRMRGFKAGFKSGMEHCPLADSE